MVWSEGASHREPGREAEEDVTTEAVEMEEITTVQRTRVASGSQDRQENGSSLGSLNTLFIAQ